MILGSCGVATSCQDMKFSQCWPKQHVVSWELLKFAVSLLCTSALLQGLHRNLPLSWPQVSLRVLSVTCGDKKQDGSYFSARPCPAKPMGPGTPQWSQQEGIIGRRRVLVLLVVLVQVNWGVRTRGRGAECDWQDNESREHSVGGGIAISFAAAFVKLKMGAQGNERIALGLRMQTWIDPQWASVKLITLQERIKLVLGFVFIFLDPPWRAVWYLCF